MTDMTHRQKQVVDLVRSGAKRADVARQLGMDKALVSRIASRFVGAPAAPRGRKPVHDRSQMEILYQAGCNDAEIGRQVGCHRDTVAVWRQARHLPPHITAGDRGISHRGAILVIDGGLTFAQAAEAVGVTRSAIAGAVFRERARRAAECET